MKRKALIFGITGQDGIMLSNHLIKKKYNVYGHFRSDNKTKKLNKKIKLFKKVKLNRKFIFEKIKKINPNEIYFLIGQSSSFISFENPHKTFESNFYFLTYVVEACIHYKTKPNIFYASSGEIYGSQKKEISEKTNKNPQNPYSLSKYISMIYIKYMRSFFDLNISTGILFNHDSEFRSKNNIFKKIINYLKNKNLKKKLHLGNIDVYRDFGLASEYVVAMHKINSQNKCDDYIIATGKSTKIRKLIDYSFKLKNMDYRDYTIINENKFSKKEIKFKSVNISKIKKLNWKPKYTIYDLIKSSLTK